MKDLGIIYKHSTHCRNRSKDIKYIVLHCSIYSPLKMIKLFNELRLSTNYIIGRNGKIYEMIPPLLVAYHAGNSSWQGSIELSLNECSIGIELEAPTLGQKKSDYTKKQISSLIDLINKLIKEYKIPYYNILGHSDIAPQRKADPGVFFPWRKLAKCGLGVWYDLRKTIKNNDEKELLEMIGYDVSNIVASRVAFCRHFYNDEVKNIVDIKELLENPFDKNFELKDKNKYLKTLQAVAFEVKNIK